VAAISSVERLICDYLSPYASIRHVATMERLPPSAGHWCTARAVQTLRRALAAIDPVIVHITSRHAAARCAS
jgi:hypothetical protein